MKPGGGKAKGNSYEGTIAKKLTAALAPLTFMRSPGSGARVGGKNFDKIGAMFGEDALKIFVADVVPLNERQEGLEFLHSIETKFYKTPDNFTALANGKANIFKWFEESVVDAAKTNRNPLLIFKWNQTPSFVAVDPKRFAHPLNVTPRLRLGHYVAGEFKELDVYDLEELLQHSSFWYRSVV